MELSRISVSERWNHSSEHFHYHLDTVQGFKARSGSSAGAAGLEKQLNSPNTVLMTKPYDKVDDNALF